MAKICVFCGQEPNVKSKEHIVPRWLIELTGDPKRQAFFGFVKDFENELKKRVYSFDQFTFPACLSCNNKYSDLESKVKPIVIKILEEKLVTTKELSLFLDWLDKVRIGLWLGMIQLDNNYANVSPNFYIESRISRFDRMLIIEKSDLTLGKLNFIGIDTFSFSLTPSVFVLRVNNYYFTNLSSGFFLHKSLGFPYPKEMFMQSKNDGIKMYFEKGTEQIMQPLIKNTIKNYGTVFYQPIFRREFYGDRLLSLYNNTHVENHCLNFNEGIGNLFQERNNHLTEYKNDDLFSVKPELTQPDKELSIRSSINVLKWQNWLVKLMPDSNYLTPEQKNYVESRFRTGVIINKMLIQHYELLLN